MLNNDPLNISGEARSAIDVVEDCLQKMKQCSELGRKLAKLKCYKRERNVTKIMLLLVEYGSEEMLKTTTESAISSLSKRIDDINHYIEEIEMLLKARNFECDECRGTGEMVTFEVIRERGSPPQSIAHRKLCSKCEGLGKMLIGMELHKTLSLFSANLSKIEVTIGSFCDSLNGLVFQVCARS